MERVSLERENGDFLYLERPTREEDGEGLPRERKWRFSVSREALVIRERDGEGLHL